MGYCLATYDKEAKLHRTIQNGGSRGFSFTIFEHSFGGIEWTLKGSDKV